MFNTMLRSARNQIECAFGRLKARWRILLRSMDLKLEDMPDIILACFFLHNIVYTHNMKDGGAIRDAITRYFAEYL